jgi:hypothetical protein
MEAFDFEAEAELFPTRSRASRRQPVGYRRFARAADAIRYAIEELPAEFLVGAFLEVNEQRFGDAEIRDLYNHADYPLERARPTTSVASSPLEAKQVPSKR